MSEQTKPGEAPRLRLAKHINLGQADATCNRCGGTGVVRYENVDDKGSTIRVPVICRCVSRNGGVQKDQLDRALEDVQRQIDDGSFGENLARDVQCLPPQHQLDALRQLQAQTERRDLDASVKRQLRSAIATVLSKIGEEN